MLARPACTLLTCLVLASSCNDTEPSNDDACSPSALSECVETPPRDCTPLYPPSFDNAFENTFSATCASPEQPGSCHANPSSEGAVVGGLVFADPDEAYAILLGQTGRAYVEPGDPECSLLMARLEAACDDLRMPPGDTPLDENERCSIMNWIAQGAAR